MPVESQGLPIIVISLCLLKLIESSQPRCLTTSESSKSNTQCVFPFRYNGTLYDGCTDVSDPDHKLWCSTKVDDGGNHVEKQGEWGFCPTPLGDCPVAIDPEVWNDILINEDDDEIDIRSTDAIPQTNKNCDSAETCESRKTCSFIDDKYKMLGSQTGRSERALLIQELKSLVCNKQQKAFCCPSCSSKHSCLSKKECPEVNDMVRQLTTLRLQQKTFQYRHLLRNIKSRICHKEKRLFCCSPISIIPFSAPERTPSTEASKPHEDSGTYLPPLGKCGVNRDTPAANVLRGETTTPGEFPFTALIGYNDTCIKRVRVKGSGRLRKKRVTCIKFKCGGTLINKRYVVTAAHCHRSFGSKKIVQVVTGEWSVGKDPDCANCTYVRGLQGQIEPLCSQCLPPLQRFDIGDNDVTVHEEYLGKANSLENDIALVRLDRPVELNGGTQMVCLPIDEAIAAKELNIFTNLVDGLLDKEPTVVGWGYTSYNPFDLSCQGNFCPSADSGQGSVGVVASKDQQKLAMPILSTEDCQVAFSRFYPGEGQLCAGGELGKDSCKGDSGSGLYLSNGKDDSPWYQVGIVSFGSSNCGSGKPGVYTRITHYIDWIKKKLKP